MKEDSPRHSLHLQNLLQYGWGVALNSAALAGTNRSLLSQQGLLQEIPHQPHWPTPGPLAVVRAIVRSAHSERSCCHSSPADAPTLASTPLRRIGVHSGGMDISPQQRVQRTCDLGDPPILRQHGGTIAHCSELTFAHDATSRDLPRVNLPFTQVRVFAHGGSMLLTMSIEAAILGLSPPAQASATQLLLSLLSKHARTTHVDASLLH